MSKAGVIVGSPGKVLATVGYCATEVEPTVEPVIYTRDGMYVNYMFSTI